VNQATAFYYMTAPWHGSDMGYSRNNPVVQIDPIAVPGIICKYCGSQWSGSGRHYLPIKDRNVLRPISSWPVPTDRWLAVVAIFREQTGMPDGFQFRPGDQVGTPIYELRTDRIHDFVRPFPGTFLVRRRVLEALERIGATGYTPIQVDTRWKKDFAKKHPGLSPPELFVLKVTGRANRVGSPSNPEPECRGCGYVPSSDWSTVEIDLDRWDGSDLFNPDMNANMVFVTERVKDAVEGLGFSNVEFKPLVSPMVWY
jgi:hypothetical protein